MDWAMATLGSAMLAAVAEVPAVVAIEQQGPMGVMARRQVPAVAVRAGMAHCRRPVAAPMVLLW